MSMWGQYIILLSNQFCFYLQKNSNIHLDNSAGTSLLQRMEVAIKDSKASRF